MREEWLFRAEQLNVDVNTARNVCHRVLVCYINVFVTKVAYI